MKEATRKRVAGAVASTGSRGQSRPGVGTYFVAGIVTVVLGVALAWAGPYPQLGVNGYVDPNSRHASPSEPNALVNPIFRGWASAVHSYEPADDVWALFGDPNYALGPATGDHRYDIVSLGERSREQISLGVPPGQITLEFAEPNTIRNGSGYDFAVFENGFVSGQSWSTLGASVGEMFAELAYVEVSSDGVNFVRFPAVSLVDEPNGPYAGLTIDTSDIYNFAGKHPNAYTICTATPFDLADLAGHPDVLGGLVDLDAVRYVRLVDIPGTGDFVDEATRFIDPNSGGDYEPYGVNHSIYDPYPTAQSAGFDLEAIGVLHEQQYSADISLDGAVDLTDYYLLVQAWQSHFGEANYNGRCDLALPKDNRVDVLDLAVFYEQWLQCETWRLP